MTDASSITPRARARRRWLGLGLLALIVICLAGWQFWPERDPGIGPLDPALGIVLRLNCGGPTLGRPGMSDYWESDEKYAQGGKPQRVKGSAITEGIPDAGPPALYDTVRRTNHYYVIRDLPPGAYTVRFHFIDTSEKAHRSMDYTINGVKVLNGFDVAGATEIWGRCVVREFVTEVRRDLRILASEDDGMDVFEAGIEIITGGGAPSPPAPEPSPDYRHRGGQSGSRAPAPDDLPWLRGLCGDGALAYSADEKIYLVELADGEAREIGSGCCVEFSPDSAKLAWIDGTVVKGRMRKGDPTVRTIADGASPAAGVHWLGNREILVELDLEGRLAWHRVSLDGKERIPMPDLDALGTGLVETDIKLGKDGVWSYVSSGTWATSDGKRGEVNGSCSVSLSPDGRSVTALLPRHRMCNLQAIREGGHTRRMDWVFADGFDNHRWSSNDARFIVCLDEESQRMAVLFSGGSYATLMGHAGQNVAAMYGDFTVGSGESGGWLAE